MLGLKANANSTLFFFAFLLSYFAEQNLKINSI